MKQKTNSNFWVRQFAKYSVGGGVYFVTGYVTFFVFDHWFKLPLFAAKQLANVAGFSANYVVQRFWTFGRQAAGQKELQLTERYLLLTLVNFMLDYLLIAALKQAGVSPYIGQFISAACFTPWNFLWYRYWVFKGLRSRSR